MAEDQKKTQQGYMIWECGNADVQAQVLTAEALKFVVDLHRRFNGTRESLLTQRMTRRTAIGNGQLPVFLPETAAIRAGHWQVAAVPSDLQNRKVEITGPVEAKMMINALNSGANVFMADFEDSLSPTWDNVVQGQLNLKKAVCRDLSYVSPEGKQYNLNKDLATLLVRPRGWHLSENHMLVDGSPVSASLFDFGLYLFHNAQELQKRGTGPYFYLPKLENHMEARLWHDVFVFAESKLGLPYGSIRVTVLIETILAAFEMEEILYELRDYVVGLNAGRWDYLFSIIKNFCKDPNFILPDRSQLTMTVPFMQAYCELLVYTCHKRGAHAIGGMAAFIPSRKDASINKVALDKVRADKKREVTLGFDGTWVAHPDLVPVARSIFDEYMPAFSIDGNKMFPISGKIEELPLRLLAFNSLGEKITEADLTNNIAVALQYIESWLRGVGAVGINNLMEDAATAEISRAQIWNWIRNGAQLADGRPITTQLYKEIRDKQLVALTANGAGRYARAAQILHDLVTSEDFIEFLTILAYDLLD